LIADPFTWALVLCAAFIGAVIGALGGFGTGVILTAVLAPIIGIKAVVPTLALAGIIINAGRFWFYRHDVNWPAVLKVSLGALPFLFLGTSIYNALDPKALGYVVGALVLFSIPMRRYLKAKNITIGHRGLIVGGGIFGLANGMASGMGIILVSLLMGAGLGGATVIATDAFITIGIDIVRALLFGKFQLLDSAKVTLGLAIGLITLPGSALAAYLVKRMDAKLHIVFMELLILGGGLMILVTAYKISS
jgi:uncharacterized protein